MDQIIYDDQVSTNFKGMQSILFIFYHMELKQKSNPKGNSKCAYFCILKILCNNPQVSEEVVIEMGIFQLNDIKPAMYQNIMAAVKAIISLTFMTCSKCIEKEKGLKNQLIIQLMACVAILKVWHLKIPLDSKISLLSSYQLFKKQFTPSQRFDLIYRVL